MKKLEDGILGLLIGDAVGVPYEFKPRINMEINPATEMVGFGTHNQPKGTWSDDSSLTLITYEVIKEFGDDIDKIANGFINWLFYGYMTPHGEVFDVGSTTHSSIRNLRNGVSPFDSGKTIFGRMEMDHL